jgi:hypothetical protein
MPRLFHIAVLFTLASLAAFPGESRGSKWVLLGIGCIEVPVGYRVVWEEGRVDFFGGYIEPTEKNWRMTGRVEEADRSFVVVSDDLLEFALPGEISNAEALLKAMLARYRSNCRGLAPESAERR